MKALGLVVPVTMVLIACSSYPSPITIEEPDTTNSHLSKLQGVLARNSLDDPPFPLPVNGRVRWFMLNDRSCPVRLQQAWIDITWEPASG